MSADTGVLAAEAQTEMARGGSLTVSHVFGEIAWLAGRSQTHGARLISELEPMVMPAVLSRQFHFFREDREPVGVALWGLLDASGEEALRSGLDDPAFRLPAEAWTAGDRLWLLDLICPFATPENRQTELMFADLVTGVFQGRPFGMILARSERSPRKLHQVSANTGQLLTSWLAEQANITGGWKR